VTLISGKDGTLYASDVEVAQMTRWRIEKTVRHKAYTANDTGGARKRVAGARDCTGRFEIQLTESGNVPVEEGDAVTLELHVDDSGNNYYEVPAVIDAIRAATDVSEGETVSLSIDFSGNGPITAYGILAGSGDTSSSGG
jgi:hypothetical protein